MVDQAVGDEARRYEIGCGAKIVQGSGGFATHSGDAQVGWTPQQAAAEALQPLLHRLHAVGARHNQPVEVLQFQEGIIQRSPVVGRADHQGGEVEHLCALGFQQSPGFPQLVGGAGHHHRAVLQRLAQAMGSRSSLTMPWALVRKAWASTGRPWVSSRVMAVRKAAREPSMSPPSSRATARF